MIRYGVRKTNKHKLLLQLALYSSIDRPYFFVDTKLFVIYNPLYLLPEGVFLRGFVHRPLPSLGACLLEGYVYVLSSYQTTTAQYNRNTTHTFHSIKLSLYMRRTHMDHRSQNYCIFYTTTDRGLQHTTRVVVPRWMGGSSIVRHPLLPISWSSAIARGHTTPSCVS